jgi:predicted secreted protein
MLPPTGASPLCCSARPRARRHELGFTLRRSLALVACAVGVAAAGVACGGQDERTFTRDDRTVAVETGERFAIELAANPSVGDDWRIVGEPDATVIRLVAEDYESDSADPAPGSGGTTRFVFDAVAAGTTTVAILNCYRCGTADEPAPENADLAETVEFAVRVS